MIAPWCDLGRMRCVPHEFRSLRRSMLVLGLLASIPACPSSCDEEDAGPDAPLDAGIPDMSLDAEPDGSPADSNVPSCTSVARDEPCAEPTWPGLRQGTIRYERGVGYTVEPLDGPMVRVADPTREGDWRFEDANGEEITLTALRRVEVIPPTFSLDATTGAGDYELFSPGDVAAAGGALPSLRSGGGVEVPFDVAAGPEGGWGPLPGGGPSVPFESPTSVGASSTVAVTDGVWGAPAGRFLLLRKALPVAELGVLRGGEVGLSGAAESDVSVFLRAPDGALRALYQDDATGPGPWATSFDPLEALAPGTNWLELYASHEVASPPPFAPISEGFDLEPLGTQLPATRFSLAAGALLVGEGAWVVSRQDPTGLWPTSGMMPTRAADLGAAGGSALLHDTNTYGAVTLGDATWTSYEVGVRIGRGGDDVIAAQWVRVSATDPAVPGMPRSGYLIFVGKPWELWPHTASVGIARVDDGVATVLVSNETDAALEAWQASDGVSPTYDPTHSWRLGVTVDGARIRLSIGRRGAVARDTDAVTVETTDTRYPTGGVAWVLDATGWIDDVEVAPLAGRGALRVDAPDVEPIQSIAAMETGPRYVVRAGQIVDLMGDGRRASNANDAMRANADGVLSDDQASGGDDERLVDYVPSLGLVVGPAEDVCECTHGLGSRDCTPGTSRSCFGGTDAQRGEGTCAPGTQICDERGAFGACLGGLDPADEVCNGADDDCDGTIDDGLSGCTPAVRCPAADSAPALAEYPLRGSAIHAGPATWRWEIECPPTVAAALCPTIEEPTSADTSVYLTASGVYRVRVEVTPSGGDTQSCVWPVTVGGEGLRVELSWDQSTDVDVDLHLHRWTTSASGRETSWGGDDDCHWMNCKESGTLDWSDAPHLGDHADTDDVSACSGAPRGEGAAWASRGSCRNPRLDIDLITCDPTVTSPTSASFCAPENINVDVPVVGAPYRVMARYYSSSGPIVAPSVAIHCGGSLAAAFGTAGEVPLDSGERRAWYVADVVFDASGGCRVYPLGGVVASMDDSVPFGPDWSCAYDPATSRCQAATMP
ncbi:MAG: hypothetical protein IT379_05920 [Deltaproteobacteria bacterium]|nr:hypothetical protein [Deltaproteobacteria bacterium]